MTRGKIVQKVGILSGTKKTKEINIVEWSEGYRVIDIRKWEDGDALKGISLSLAEAVKLQTYLNEAILVLKSMEKGSVNSMDVKKLGFAPIKDSDVNSDEGD